MSLMSFEIAPQIHAASFFVRDLPLSQLRAMDDARFPWLLLVPRRSGVEEWCDLDSNDTIQLAREITIVTRLLIRQSSPVKVNVATLGNIVRQLHVHVIARQTTDPAWPGPVWGVGTAIPYSGPCKQRFCDELLEILREVEMEPDASAGPHCSREDA